MSSRIFRRHTRKQKNLAGSEMQQGSGIFGNLFGSWSNKAQVVDVVTGDFKFYNPNKRTFQVYIIQTGQVRPFTELDKMNISNNAQQLQNMQKQLGLYETNDVILFNDPERYGERRRFDPKTGITLESYDNFALRRSGDRPRFYPDPGYTQMDPYPYPMGGNIRRRVIKRGKTRRGGKKSAKTYRHKK